MAINLQLRHKTPAKQSIVLSVQKGSEFNNRTALPFKTCLNNWDKKKQCLKKQINPKTVEDKNRNSAITKINLELSRIKNSVELYIDANPFYSKEDAKAFVENDLFPERKKEKSKKEKPHNKPSKLSELIDFYILEKSKSIEGRQRSITDSTIKFIYNIKNRIAKYGNINIIDINEDLRDDLTIWAKTKEKLSPATIVKMIKYLKTFCLFAKEKGIAIDENVLGWKFVRTSESSKMITFSVEEVNAIKQAVLPDNLHSTREWLLIGISTSLRISDLLTLTKQNIIEEDGKKYIRYFEQKGKKERIISIFGEAEKVLSSRNWEFPKTMAKPTYNNKIKKVCELSGMTELIEGNIRNSEGKYQKGKYPKYQLVASHMCRRSFVTQHSNTLSPEIIAMHTGHESISMVKNYDHSSQKSKADAVKDAIMGVTKNKNA